MKKFKRTKNKCICSFFSLNDQKTEDNEDPVLAAKQKKKKQHKDEPTVPGTVVKEIPSFGVREGYKSHCVGNEPVITYGDPRIHYEMPQFIPPKTKKYVKERQEARKKYEGDLNFCKHILEATQLPDAPAKEKVLQITIPSPEQSEAKVHPRGLSPTISTIVPIKPNPKKLELKKPKSGIIINETKAIDDYDSFDLVYTRKPRPGFEKDIISYRKSKKKKKILESINEDDEQKDMEARLEKEMNEFAETAEDENAAYTEAPTVPIGEETELTKVFRKKVEMMSKATAYQGEEKSDEESVDVKPNVGQMTQKFRRSSEINRFDLPPPKIKRGTLESHSFTKTHQPTLKDFYYGTIAGTMHQDANHFPESIRNRQGLTMPITAYCYALLKHPSSWEEKDIDEILESGNIMYADCLEKMNGRNEISGIPQNDDLPKYCFLKNKKIRFNLSEPQITGLIKSDQKNIYNLSKGMRIFFSKYPAGIFQTKGADLAIWRDEYYYLFDAKPRTKDLYMDPKGTALMANFYDVDSVISVLLDRCMFGNWPFVISALEAFSIQDKHEPDETESTINIEDKTKYFVVNENKAVLQGSFELADKCFEFARNKQALAMATIALIYSRISPPSSWFKKIVDKIMIIGNQLYLECVNYDTKEELKLDQLPAEFTLGPYYVEIYVKPNIYGDFICKKGKCVLETCLEKFFKNYSMALVVLGDTTVAIWKQRGVYYCFDPYSRNEQGHKERNGKACVSMHTNIDSLTWLIAKNFCDKENIFYIHALVVCRILREKFLNCTLPLNVTMTGIPIEDLKKTTKKRGKRTATEGPIKIPLDTKSVMAEPPIKLKEGESLVEVESNVGSLAMSTLPRFSHIPHFKVPAKDGIVDLDSPSLSDTQIEPPPIKDEEKSDLKVDIDSYQLTMEELEGIKKGEGDEAKIIEMAKQITPIPAQSAPPAGDQTTDKPDEEDFYMAADATTSVGSKSFLANTMSRRLSAEISGFMMHPEVLPPTNLTAKLERKRRLFDRTKEGSMLMDYEREPDVTQSEELRKENNFVDLPDNSQIVRGKTNMANLDGQDGDVEFLAPFVCIMATAVAKKFSLVSWSPDVVDYVLKCGQELHKASKFRYDQVSRLDIPKVSLGSTDFRIIVEYLFDTHLKDNILELALERILFMRSDCGIFVTPSYACAVFYRHHLYYLYDGYGNNEVGMSEGNSNNGVACLVRFKDLRSLAQRIIYNKLERESVEPVEFSRFVISRVTVTALNPPKPPLEEYGEDDGDDEWVDIDDENDDEDDDEEDEEDNPNETKPKIEVGWKWYKRTGTIRGSKSLQGRGVGDSEIKQDHFVCICACLMLIEVPIDKWDSIKVDFCLDQGENIFNHADDLCATEKRIIKNVLIRKHFFDIIVKKIQILNFSQNKNIATAIDTLFGQRYSYFIIQMVGCCNVVYQDKDKNFYLFDPYAIDRRGRPTKEGRAGWTRYRSLKSIKRRLMKESNKYGGLYSFYTFEVTSIKKAPKGVRIGENLHLYKETKPKKKEKLSKPFHEEVYWLNMDPVPWSRLTNSAPTGIPRCSIDNMWHNWVTEYNNDLFSMVGNVHQSSQMFPLESRGKQTLCNLVMAIGMIQIYSLNAWSPPIIDSILVNGDNYCRDCIAEIKEENYELSVTDLKQECEIFPYTFKIKISNLVDGTMFLLRSSSFNLYKALRYFFDDYERRFGIITVSKYNGKRQVAFGKTRELEYFMFDCEAVGAPMFPDGEAVAYILRTTTLNRLLHVLTLTLRGGDFFIFEVKAMDFKPVN